MIIRTEETGQTQACAAPNKPMTDNDLLYTKQCAYCQQQKPLCDFRRRTGKRSKGHPRRGACKECRKQRNTPNIKTLTRTTLQQSLLEHPKENNPSASSGPSNLNRKDPSQLIPSTKGLILMRGHSDKGLRWHQEIALELAVTLVKEHAAIIVNRRTIRRIYSNKDFRAFILTRDSYTCYFCGSYGDTIDHLLPRAKGGHTTPDNCVCACTLCNQTKADQYVEQFMGR